MALALSASSFDSLAGTESGQTDPRIALLQGETTVRSSEDTGSPDLFAPALDRASEDFLADSPAHADDTTLRVNLVLHILSGSASEGDLSDAVVARQMSVLNDAYRAAGISFNLAEVRRYPNSPYFAGGCFPTIAEGIRMKAELAVDPARFVNVYTCELLLPYLVGYGTLPDEFPEADSGNGIVIDYRTLPGSAAPLNLGHTLIHEAGHYFGLLHTFQGGCSEPGDDVADTPPEAAPAFGCPTDRDSCPQAGVDPVTNFMDYSDDSCTAVFTSAQRSRMRALIATFRPRLTAPEFTIGPGITGNWYNPDESGQGFSVEVLAGNQMLVEWFVFGPDGGPVWIIAMGPITGNTAVLSGYQVMGAGGRFPPNFDPTQLHHAEWGTLVLKFTDCDNGEASWQPTATGYPSGSMPLKRLTMPAGLSCP